MSARLWTRVTGRRMLAVVLVGVLGILPPAASSLQAQGELGCIRITDALLPAGTPPFGKTCSRAVTESALRSAAGEAATVITFVNRRKAPVHVYWVNYTGHRVFYRLLEPGRSFRQATFVTHPWIVTTETGDPLAAFLPGPREGIAVIR